MDFYRNVFVKVLYVEVEQLWKVFNSEMLLLVALRDGEAFMAFGAGSGLFLPGNC